jgi:transcriptional regulator
VKVRRLADQHERGRAEPWSVDDAPPPYIAGQLKAIVGVEVVIDRVEGNVKLSQNRSDADMAGSSTGWRRSTSSGSRPQCGRLVEGRAG